MAVWYMGRVLARTPAPFSASPGAWVAGGEGLSENLRSESDFCKQSQSLIGLDTTPGADFIL